MKISTRVRLVVIGALFATMFVVGSAWADEASVVNAIRSFGLERKAGETGSTITVINASENPLVKDVTSNTSAYLLNLGDLAGLTIDWQANLTVLGEMEASHYGQIIVILFQNGTFNMTAGTIDVQATKIGYANTIEGRGRNDTITVSGGTVRGLGVLYGGATVDQGNGTVNVTGGTLDFPNGVAANSNTVNITMNDGMVINGLVGIFDDSTRGTIIDVYGTTNSIVPFDFDETPPSIEYTVKNGALWNVSSDVLLMATAKYSLLVEEGGKMVINGSTAIDLRGILSSEGEITIKCPINIHGTLTNKGKVTNDGTINNYSSATVDNQGTWTNNGTINNKSTGKIKNTGTIDNTSSGKIVNEGTFENTGGTVKNDGTFQSDQTEEQMGGNFTGSKKIEALNHNTSSGGSSGCNAGFGLFGLVAGALMVLKRK